MTNMTSRARWLALLVLCLGDLMIVLDVTIVGVALPSIREDLGFSEESLAWVVNAYIITFGGFLLLGGRLGDLFGHRRLFLLGIGLFTLASAACGLATSQEMLIGARAVQGVGGAVVSAVALSLMMTLFTEPAERAKAMGVFGFVASGSPVSVACYIDGENMTIRSQVGQEVVSRVQVLVAAANLTTTGHRYTLPSRFVPYSNLTAIGVDRVSDEDEVAYERIHFP